MPCAMSRKCPIVLCNFDCEHHDCFIIPLHGLFSNLGSLWLQIISPHLALPATGAWRAKRRVGRFLWRWPALPLAAKGVHSACQPGDMQISDSNNMLMLVTVSGTVE